LALPLDSGWRMDVVWSFTPCPHNLKHLHRPVEHVYEPARGLIVSLARFSLPVSRGRYPRAGPAEDLKVHGELGFAMSLAVMR
jgi:hypothetical protein